MLARERQRVERDEPLREGARRRVQLLDRKDPAAGHDLLVDRVQPVGAGDDRRPAGRREAELDRAPDLEEFRGQKDVEGPRDGIEREDRRVVRRGVSLARELHVVRRGSRPLSHAGDGGAVGGKPVLKRGVHDPFRQHAAPLPADGGNEEGKNVWSGWRLHG